MTCANAPVCEVNGVGARTTTARGSSPMLAKPESVKVAKEYARPEIVFTIDAIPQTRRLVFGGSDFQVYELDLAQEKPEPRALGGHESYVTGLAVAGGWAVSGGYDGHLKWWDLDARKEVRTVAAHTKWIRNVVATPD